MGCGRCDRFLGMWGAIAFGGCGGRSLFVDVGGDRCLGCGRAIVFWDMGGRSLFGMWGAIAFGCGRAIAFWGVGCDSEALRRNLFWEMRGAIALIMRILEVRSLFGCGRAIAFEGVGVRSLLGVWECDRFLGCVRAIAFWGCGDAIAF